MNYFVRVKLRFQEFQDLAHHNLGAFNARLTVAYMRINVNSLL